MSVSYIEISNSEQALHVFTRLSGASEAVADRIILRPGWATLQVRIPDPPIPSSISPSMMEAYISIQREFYQLAAFAKTGRTDTRRLTDIDRRELEILVKVTEGSSVQFADLYKTIDAAVKRMTGKLSGRQVVIIALGFGLLFALPWCFNAYLEAQKSMRIEDAKTTERLQALNAMQFATQQQREMFEFIIQQLAQTGAIGQRSRQVVDNSYAALLRAAEHENVIEINGERITSEQAALLRSTTRIRPVTRFVIERMRVISINTAADVDAIVLMRPKTMETFTIRLSETLFSGNDREKLFEALENRATLTVELAFREYGGEIRHTFFNRVVP